MKEALTQRDFCDFLSPRAAHEQIPRPSKHILATMPTSTMSRMHPSHMSNPFAHLNPQHTIQPSHYQTQSIPTGFNSQHVFRGSLNSFPSTYGANAFTASSVFSGGALPGQGQGLASIAAQQGFARGAAMQEHSAHQVEVASMDAKSGAQGRIRQVWRHNLEQEMVVLRQLIRKYSWVSMVSRSSTCVC